jgi:hypothetical protein
MRLDWNDIKARAAKFAEEWKDATYERGQTQTFYNEFFEVFGVPRKRVASFEHGVKLPEKKRGYLDLFWKGKLLVEHKSAGRDLKAAKRQALDYFPGLKDHELPRYILLSDFQTFELFDLDIEPEKPLKFRLSDLADNVQSFGFIVGQERRVFRDQDPVNIKASEMMGALHDALEKSGYKGHALERFLVRLLFCLFADDTGIFQPLGIFEDFIKERTSEDGRDVGARLEELFQVLNTPEDERQTNLDADLAKFPYINGDLFGEALRITAFNRDMRDKLLNVCGFYWEKISPAIFGSLFQSVMNKKERRKKGAHYTSEKNILKVIEPLFMDDLKAEFSRLKARRDAGRTKALVDFQGRLAKLTFFDPACGCGNFLVIAYRELRELELEVIRELNPEGQRVTDVGLLTRVNVDQFYGIEISEFPARIAEVAMWMMDHIMNVKLSAAFGESYLRIPLKNSPNIKHGDALEVEWESVLPSNDCSYVFGNPPFIGQSYQSKDQRAQMARIVGTKRGGSLDYVTAWFLKAGAYVKSATNSKPRIAFVSTNSITQGEQVAQLWPLLFERCQLEIAFGHRTFEWNSDAKGKAHVHCVIVGLNRNDDVLKEKRLFNYASLRADPEETKHTVLSPYLFDASALNNPRMIIRERRTPIGKDMRSVRMGSKIVDDGIYILSPEEKNEFILKEPESEKYIRPLIGSEEFINGKMRYILYLYDISPAEIRSLPLVGERIDRVKKYREKSKKTKTRELSNYPTHFEVKTVPDRAFIAIPKVSSERRDYLPVGWLQPPTLPSQLVQVMVDADLMDFALLTSAMHVAWLRAVGGRMKSDYQYSIGLVYNAFPWPSAPEETKTSIRTLAQAVLDARAKHSTSTLADMYDPLSMPPDLRKAHKALDDAVDKLYRPQPFSNDRERVEHLFTLYEKLTADLLTAKPAKRARGKRTQNA